MDYWSSRALRPVSTGALLNSLADFKQAVALLQANKDDRSRNEFLREMEHGIHMITKELERRGMTTGLDKPGKEVAPFINAV